MPRIKDYPRATELGNNDVFLVDGEAGTRGITSGDLPHVLSEISNFDDRYAIKNQHVRGKNLGSSITQSQLQTIRNGTFYDMFLGDYWTFGSIKYHIVHFDYYYTVYNHATASYYDKHHVILLPSTNVLTNQSIHTSTTFSTKASAQTSLYTSILPSWVDNAAPVDIKNNALLFTVSTPSPTNNFNPRTDVPKKAHIPTLAQLGYSDGFYVESNSARPFAYMQATPTIWHYGGNTAALYSQGFAMSGEYAYCRAISNLVTDKVNVRPYIIIG